MKIRLAAVAILLAAFSTNAWAAMGSEDLNGRLQVVQPVPGIQSIEVLSSPCGKILAAVADLEGKPLPARDSIIIAFHPEGDRPTHSAFIPGGIIGPYWTEPAWSPSLADVNPDTQFALWREENGEWGAMIPLVGDGMRASFRPGRPMEMRIVSESFHEGWAPKRVPLFAIGHGDDPYALTRALYTFAMQTMHDVDPQGVIGRLRWEKDYPEVFRYIGWCSWNSHYRYVKAQDLVDHAESFKRAGFPLGFVLIDDGWQSVNRLTMIPWAQGSLYLTGFEANDKFPGGLASVIKTLKGDYGIRYVGVWHTFQGYWNGVELDSPLGEKYRDALLPLDNDKKASIPDPRSDAGEKFWEDWYAYLSGQGVDFVKVDNQSTFSGIVGGSVPVSKGMAQAQANLQGPAEKYFDSQMINCMEMNIDVVYQWRTTNIARSSGDYVPIFPHNPRTHILKNVMNAMWISNLAWPDYDMFKTHDQHVDYHTVARAMSGGPVYITDNAGRERFELLWPLILKDGEVLRVDEPGLPIRKSLLDNPKLSGKPLVSFARIGRAGMLAAWAVDKYERPVKIMLSPSDVEGIAGERFAVYEHFTGELKVLGREEEFEVKLGRWGARLYSVVPLEDGFAAIGLADKLLSPATVKAVERGETVKVSLREAGRFIAYSAQPPLSVKRGGEELPASRVSYKNGRLEIDEGAGAPAAGVELEIRF